MDNTAPEPNNFLNWVDIKNFKSIKDLHLDCKRVNVFIGKPNVGKSNILEGLGLLGAGYDDTNKLLKGTVRYKRISDMFWDKDVNNLIQVITDSQVAALGLGLGVSALDEKGQEINRVSNFGLCAFDTKEFFQVLDDTGSNLIIYRAKALKTISEFGDSVILPDNLEVQYKYRDKRTNLMNSLRLVKKYDFDNITEFSSHISTFLSPPNGRNLYAVVRRESELWIEFVKLFAEQQLEFVLHDEKQEFILQKKNGPFVVQYPFFSVADTFRRYMFYITAIESNKNSVIIFEEPEVHSFPPYVKAMAHRMVSSDTNQFFVSTHSPYLLQTLISELDESELAVYITYYQDYQTHVRQLTADELQEAQDLGIDLFYNLSRYEPNA